MCSIASFLKHFYVTQLFNLHRKLLEDTIYVGHLSADNFIYFIMNVSLTFIKQRPFPL